MSDEILKAILKKLGEIEKEHSYRFSQINDRFSQIDKDHKKMARDISDIKRLVDKGVYKDLVHIEDRVSALEKRIV